MDNLRPELTEPVMRFGVDAFLDACKRFGGAIDKEGDIYHCKTTRMFMKYKVSHNDEPSEIEISTVSRPYTNITVIEPELAFTKNELYITSGNLEIEVDQHSITISNEQKME